jgi:ganglioside GM2 activator
MSLKLIKLIGPVKFEVPCIDNFGSCTYKDVCVYLPHPSDCPQYFKDHNIPCSCPFASGDYTATNIEIQLNVPKVPSGGYIVTANFQDNQGNHIGCVELDLKVK